MKLNFMAGIKASVTITKSDGKAVKFANDDADFVKEYNERNCPSYFKREFLHKMFD